MAKCYMCNEESTSREHAPPDCFFPAGMKKNLITVRSCPAHNEETSAEDEYCRNWITTSIQNNQTGLDHFLDKGTRSLQFKKADVLSVLETLRDVSFHAPGAKAFQLDRPRFERVIKKVAYALFYKSYGYTWDRKLAALTNGFKLEDMTNDDFGKLYEDMAPDLSKLPLLGDNPLVFQYAFIDSGSGQHEKGLFMLFYGGFPFLMIPDGTTTEAGLD